MSNEEEARFEGLLQFLRQQRGFDFTGYKRPSLMRRVARRMQDLKVGDFEQYRDYLEVHPEEFALLFNTILINVTSFFRDEHAWEFLEKKAIPCILEAKGSEPAVRVWSAGCAAGQEAYSVAMLLAEAMGEAAFRERVKLYATDVDEEALNQARLASYSAKEMETVPPRLRERYFEPQNSRHVFRNDLRRSVIFGRHDLVQDAPISRVDLLVCRNTLMYFNAETQSHVLQRFHFALNGEQSVLFLGRAEMLLTHGGLFTPLDMRCRVFVKVAPPEVRLRLALPLPAGSANGTDMTSQRLRELAIEESPVARIVVDANGTLVIANQRARLLFSLNARDIGRPLQDLEISYRPTELRSLIEQAYSERRVITQASVERRFADGETQYLDVVVQPLFDNGQSILGAGVSFLDTSRYTRMLDELQRNREEVQTANEELQTSNEELETTNEELQSSNEELETTNEELQSTNEELETMNEELQSTNQELQTVNEELRNRTEEVSQLNAFLQSVLTGLRSAAIVLDRNLNVMMWNRRAEDMWGLRTGEVQGKPLLTLDIGLPVVELSPMIRACLNDGADHREITLDAVSRRGKKLKCRVACSPLTTSEKKRDGVILTMEEAE